MGGSLPRGPGEPRVLYVGEDARTVAASWNAEERPFEVVPAGPGEVSDAVAETTVEAVVYHSDGSGDGEAVLQAARRAGDDVPVVVLATGDGVSFDDAIAVGATYVDIEAGFDPIERLAAVAPLVERHRETVRERAMLDSLLEHIPLSVYWKDRQSRHVRVSDAMVSMVGPDYIENPDGARYHTPADVVGNSDWDLYSDELAESATEDDRRVMETETPIVDRVERGFGTLDGETFVATSKAPWYDEQGQVVGMVGISRDITERMQYERQLERQNERLEQFAQLVSHDLRNPLEVARGRLELLRTDADVEEHADALDRALDRMDALVSDVLTLAREGAVVADPEPVDTAAVAEAAWDLVDATDAGLVVDVEGEVLADAGRLQQILENLFRNALEHGRAEDGDDLTVTVGGLSDGGFYVADDGPGVPSERRETVFEVGVSSGEDGTGLGLGIVRSIAEAHGWTVALREGDDGGARFEFTDVRRPS